MNLNTSDFEDGLRGVALGLFVIVAMLVVAACFFVGAYVIGRWAWSLA